MKKILAMFLAVVMIFSLVACGGESQKAEDKLELSSDTLAGTWYFTQGDLYKTDKTTLRFEIYKGGTAEEIYEDNSLNMFKWEISESDPDVVNFEMQSIFGSLGGTRGFTLEVIDGLIQLHSVDGKIILTKDSSPK